MACVGIAPTACPASRAPPRPKRAWHEVELLLLAILVLGVYFTRLTDLTIRGEEPRWARVAQEMLDTGDWIVPRQQSEPFPDRPPLNSWAMILSSRLTGELNLAAIRLPAVTATLLITLAIYLYSRNYLSRVGALAAAAAYPTTVQVLQLGSLSESDSLLTLCVAGALFSWHYGYSCRASARLAWIAGYAATALAGLAKGPQGPIYFITITTVFLALRRDWSFLFNRWHVAGLAVFVLVVGAWQLPFYWELDATSAQAIWSEGGEMSSRFDYANVWTVLGHWASYPFEVLACMMPWSFMLSLFASRWFRTRIAEASPMVAFLLTAIAIALPTCWLPVPSRARYFMSLYPCVAPLVGLAIQRCWESRENGWWQRGWDRFLVIGAGSIVAAGLFVGIVGTLGRSGIPALGQAVSPGFAIFYALAALGAAAAVLWSRRGRDARHADVGILAVAGFMGMTWTGVVVSVQMRTSNDPSATVAAVRAMIPPGERLVSLGKVHHLFAYYYGAPIELQKLGESKLATEMPGTYFCFAIDPKFKAPTIPFAWSPVVEISCERSKSPHPVTKVVVGRRAACPTRAPSAETAARESTASLTSADAGDAALK